MKKGKRIIFPIMGSLTLFFAGILWVWNIYLSIVFLLFGIFCVYYLSKDTIKITYGPEGSLPPKGSNGDLFLTYKEK